MKLKDWASNNGISYRTAWRWFHQGTLPVPAQQTSTGTILVHAPVRASDGVALYARVSSGDQRADLDRQVARLTRHAIANGWHICSVVAEVGSGMNGRRTKLKRLLSETDCVVIFGSHNLGFKASYANDENMLILKGNRSLAPAYAAHVMDVFEHYRFRATLEQQVRDARLAGKAAPERAVDKGFVDTDPKWQQPYLDGHKGREGRYFLSEDL